ncbi:MAG: glycosyltransferase family 1 protein [Verrucomicrobia bacterium]|nr:MAG: glycosyltransferase family 1 protein [Verrucomicrobiota bacterium]
MKSFELQNSLLKEPYSNKKSLSLYSHEILRALAEGKKSNALCWRIASDAARNYSRQCHENEILFTSNPGDFNARVIALRKTQEVRYRLAKALEKKSLSSLSPYWFFEKEELREAVWNYRYWMNVSQVSDSPFLEYEIAQVQKVATKYLEKAPKTNCLYDEAQSWFLYAQKIAKMGTRSLDDEVLIYRCKLVAYSALLSAIFQRKCEAPLLESDKKNHDHWNRVLNFATSAFQWRIKAAQAAEEKEEECAIDWSLAAHAASLACDIEINRMELFSASSQEVWELLTHALNATVEAMKKRAEVASMVHGKQREAARELAYWSEYSYESYLKSLELYYQQKKALSLHWKKVTKKADGIIDAWQQIVLKKEKNHHHLFNFYWSWVARYRESFHRKKIAALLWEEFQQPWQNLSFFLPEPLLPQEKCLKAWREGKISPETEFTCSHSWIYQTVEFLKEASIPCDLSMAPKKCGIMLALTSATDPTFGINPPLSPDVFLVDIVADASPHPTAHFYIVQNRVQAKRLRNAFFIPHWPQSRLIPRNPQRGTCFKNIVFFGEKQNLAMELISTAWHHRLEQELGLTFTIAPPSEWNDYSQVDCAIGIRDFSKSPHYHKPATKLYNAWLAGVPFIGGSDVAYACDGHPGKDYLVATSLEEFFVQLRRLKESEELRSRLINNGFCSVKNFTKEATRERWKKLIQEILPQRALKHQKMMLKKG